MLAVRMKRASGIPFPLNEQIALCQGADEIIHLATPRYYGEPSAAEQRSH